MKYSGMRERARRGVATCLSSAPKRESTKRTLIEKSSLDKHWINGSDFAQQAAAAPAIVSFMANAAADGLVGSSKCLE